ncbi:MAG: hypothetical protein WD269_12235 [Acidimicrobiia bacterium]
MSKELRRLAGLNPYPPDSFKRWGGSAEGKRVFESAILEGDLEPADLAEVSHRRIRPWTVAWATAALTLAVFVPVMLFRGDAPGQVGGPVPAIEQPITTTSSPVEPSAPSAELLAYLLPISGAEVASVNYIWMAGFQERLDRVDACLRGEGFDFDFQSTMPPDLVLRARNHLPAYDSLRKYGFIPTWTNQPPGYPPGVDYIENDLNNALEGFVPFPEGVSAAEARAIVNAYQDCSSEASGIDPNSTGSLLTVFDGDYELLGGNFELLLRDLDNSHPDVVSAFDDFQACVRGRGWDFDTSRDDGSENNSIDPFLGAAQGVVFESEDPAEQRETDARVVTDLVECMAPVEAVRQDLRVDLRETYIDDHWADLVEAEGRFSAALREMGIGTQG